MLAKLVKEMELIACYFIASKGLEFEEVCIADLMDGRW